MEPFKLIKFGLFLGIVLIPISNCIKGCTPTLHRNVTSKPQLQTVLLNNGNVKFREVHPKQVLYRGDRMTRICHQDSNVMRSVCNTCAAIAKVINESAVLTPLPSSTAADKCKLKNAYFDSNSYTIIQVMVRKCSAWSPAFYVSEGNADGWVHLYTSLGSDKPLQYETHQGPFRKLLHQ